MIDVGNGRYRGAGDDGESVAIGEAVWRSVEENRPIDIADLLGLNQSLEETRS